MDKILAVARSEYLTAVRSKAFLAGVLLMPVMMFGSIFMMKLAQDQVDTRDRKFALVDYTGQLAAAVERAAEQRDASDVWEGEGDEKKQVQPRFLLENIEPDGDDAASREKLELELSDRVREKGDLFAFVVVDPGVVSMAPHVPAGIDYHTETPTYDDLPRWLSGVLNEEVQHQRFANEPGLDPELVQRITRNERVRRLGLSERGEDGEIVQAREESDIENKLVPLFSMMLLFMLVMTTTPYMLNAVLEEKMQKISEVLVSAVSPFQLMMGKLFSAALVSLTLSFLYLGAVRYITERYGFSSMVPDATYAWFLLFQILALLIFGSMFSAIGAACSEMRDAQSMMMPAMLLVMLPMFLWGPVMDSPDSPLAVGASLFPPATPMLMMLRISIPPGPPLWQVVTGIGLTIAFTVFCVWAAGKVFRIGILSQGKAPNLLQLARWVFGKS